MNTPSHLIITAGLRKGLRRRVQIPRAPFLLGSVVPDIPLALLSIGSLIYFRWFLGESGVGMMDRMFDDMYFHNPWWIAAHNVFHSPTLLLIELALLWRFRDRAGSRLRWCFWFVLGCLLHSGVDILTHYNDGPVLFFPFEWTIRFHSPVSYWDPRHYGRQFTIFELALDLVLLAYLLIPPLRDRLARRFGRVPAEQARLDEG